MIGPRTPLRLPPHSFDGSDTDDASTFGVFVGSDRSWKGTPVGGPNRYSWPLVGTLAFEAQFAGMTEDDFMATPAAIVSPGRPFGRGASACRVPRAVLVLDDVLASSDGASVYSPAYDAVMEMAGDLEAADVYGGQSCLFMATNGGLFSIGFPAEGYKSFSWSNDDSGAQLYKPDPATDDYVGGEVLLLSTGTGEARCYQFLKTTFDPDQQDPDDDAQHLMTAAEMKDEASEREDDVQRLSEWSERFARFEWFTAFYVNPYTTAPGTLGEHLTPTQRGLLNAAYAGLGGNFSSLIDKASGYGVSGLDLGSVSGEDRAKDAFKSKIRDFFKLQ